MFPPLFVRHRPRQKFHRSADKSDTHHSSYLVNIFLQTNSHLSVLNLPGGSKRPPAGQREAAKKELLLHLKENTFQNCSNKRLKEDFFRAARTNDQDVFDKKPWQQVSPRKVKVWMSTPGSSRRISSVAYFKYYPNKSLNHNYFCAEDNVHYKYKPIAPRHEKTVATI